jgi:hypothetical protein
MSGCRDCARCTESAVKKLFLLPLRIVVWCLTIWNIRLFQKYCPQCHHLMNRHTMVRGRFQD